MKGYFESNQNFIKLTKSYNKEPINYIFVNPGQIISIERKNSKETYIRVVDGEGIWVVESPEDIIKIM